MKNASKIAVVALGVAVSLTLFSCSKQQNNQSKSEVEMLSELVFTGKIKDMNIFISTDSIHASKPGVLVAINAKANPVNDTWEEAGVACNAEQLVTIYTTKILPQYSGNAGFDLKIEVANDEGCRKVYHRTAQLGE
jgi:hypothetical protein